MNKESKIEQLRKAIILGCHQGKTYEEALEAWKRENYLMGDLLKISIDDDVFDLQAYDCISRANEIQNCWEALKLISKNLEHPPITLSKVLQALGEKYPEMLGIACMYEKDGIGVIIDQTNARIIDDTIKLCDWLLTVDGRTATIEDQTEETVEKLLELLRENSEFPNY